MQAFATQEETKRGADNLSMRSMEAEAVEQEMLLQQIYNEPWLVRRVAITDKLHAFINSGNREKIGEYLFSYSQQILPQQNASPIQLIPEHENIYEKHAIIERYGQSFPEAKCLTTTMPSAILGRAGKTLDVPETNIIIGSNSNFQLSYNYNLPLVTCEQGGHKYLIPELSSPSYFGVNIRGGVSVLEENLIKLDAGLFIHDHFGGNNYAHWLLDWLPRFAVLQKLDKDISKHHIVFPMPMNQAQIESIKKLQMDTSNILQLSRNHSQSVINFSFNHIVGCSTSGPDQRHPAQHGARWAIHFLRSLFSPAIKPLTRRKLILNRRGTRKLIFDSSTIARLEEQGFEEVYTEEMSVTEQAYLFASADCIISAHGAGLSNLVFCERNTKVLEIFPEDYSTSAFFVISHAAELDYYCAVGISLNKHKVSHLRDAHIQVPENVISTFLNS